jgi:PaaX-like protein
MMLDDQDSAVTLLQRLVPGGPPRATGFIVTVCGDVVVPRRGVLWMGTLVRICAGLGLSEGLVRTAMSRLVAGGRLGGRAWWAAQLLPSGRSCPAGVLGSGTAALRAAARGARLDDPLDTRPFAQG